MTFNNTIQGTLDSNTTFTCIVSGGYPAPEVYMEIPSANDTMLFYTEENQTTVEEDMTVTGM